MLKIPVCLLALAIISCSFGFSLQGDSTLTQPAPATLPVDDDFSEVDDMHHFMEYVCNPCFRELKKAMAAEPKNRREWKPVKVNAIILAETSSIVAARGPQDDAAKMAEWKKIAKSVHVHGKKLYESAGKSDFKEATQQYGLMIESCNKCHQVFDDGKHQLKK